MGLTDADLADAQFVAGQHFEPDSVAFDELAGLGHAAEPFAHQAAHRGGFDVFSAMEAIDEIGNAIEIEAAGDDEAAIAIFGDIAFGNDTIVGFDPARDTVRLSHNRVADLDALRSETADVGGGTLIALGNGQSITIAGVASSSLGPGNLIIV